MKLIEKRNILDNNTKTTYISGMKNSIKPNIKKMQKIKSNLKLKLKYTINYQFHLKELLLS